LPDADGHFGPYGGRFVAETLMGPLEELRRAYQKYIEDPEFLAQLDEELRQFVGRPSPLYHAARWSGLLGGARIYLKREDLNHTGAHKINNTVGQGLLAQRMGKTRIIAETGAGQHGVATATVAARLGMECVVYMGAEDIQRQALNVDRMRLVGAEVIPVTSGSQTLKDAMKFTGAKTKREAVVIALEDFNRKNRMAGLLKYFGTFKNMMTVEDENTLLVIDAGLMFPEDYMLGVDLVIPRMDYILKHRLIILQHLLYILHHQLSIW